MKNKTRQRNEEKIEIAKWQKQNYKKPNKKFPSQRYGMGDIFSISRCETLSESENRTVYVESYLCDKENSASAVGVGERDAGLHNMCMKS